MTLILGFNLVVPLLAMSFFNTKDMKKSMGAVGSPNETDRFMMRKGGN